jgi:hypothetical protein
MAERTGGSDMAGATYFVQPCPTCGRRLEVRVRYIGRRVVCRHCRGEFTAADPESRGYRPESSGVDLLRHADRILDELEGAPRTR